MTQEYKQVPPGIIYSAGLWSLHKVKKEVCGLVINVCTNLNFMTPTWVTVKMTTEDSEYLIHSSLVCYRKITGEGKSHSVWQISMLSFFKILPQLPWPSTTTILSVSSHWHWCETLHHPKDYNSLKPHKMVSIVFSNKGFLN